MVVDDGTGAITGVLNQKLTEKILGKTLEECKKMDDDDLVSEMNKQLFARRINMKGNALGDNFGTTFIPKDAELLDVKVEEEAEKLSEDLEDLR